MRNCASGNLEILRCAMHIVVRCGACHRAALRADPLASPRNDELAAPAHVLDDVESVFLLRQKSNFVNAIKLICPVQSLAQKYFGFSETQIAAI
jgi:hypothetical protein